MFGRYLWKTKRFWNAILPRSSFNLWLKRVWRIMEIALADCYKKKNLISMYRGALVSGFVNMLVYLNT